MTTKRSALGRLLQERRQDLGYSRTRLGELAAIRPATLEAWELGRGTKPPIHDVLRLARFLELSLEEIETAVLADEGANAAPRPRRRALRGVVPLLEQAIELFDWTDEQAAAALQTSPEHVRAWLNGDEVMPLPELITVTSLVVVHAAAAMGGQAALAEVAQELAGDAAPQRRY